MAVKRAALIHFADHVSLEEARAALESIGAVLETPFSYPPEDLTAGDYVREYDPEWGGPVWYIP
jgi:hypothetical protein